MKQWNEVFKNQGRFFLKINKELPKAVKIFRKNNVKKILDLGCGSGRHVLYLAERGFDMSGADIAEAGIKIAKQWLKENGLKADLKIGNIYKKLPYRDNTFDAVVSTNAIHHAKIEDIRKAIKEIERILKPGGMIFINCRRRPFYKAWQKNGVSEISWEKQRTPFKVIAPRTYMPIAGMEKGLPHYLFNKRLIQKEFKNFKNLLVRTESNKRHYCFIGKLNKR